MTPTTIRITVTPEAAVRVAELGMQAELDQMLEHTRQTVPGLKSIEVQETLPYDTGDETTISAFSRWLERCANGWRARVRPTRQRGRAPQARPGNAGTLRGRQPL